MCRAGRGAGEECSKCLQAEKKPSSAQPLTFLNDRDAFMYSISYCGCFAVTAAFCGSLLWTDTHRPSLARLIILSVKASEILNAHVSGDLSAFLSCGNCHGVGVSALPLRCCCLWTCPNYAGGSLGVSLCLVSMLLKLRALALSLSRVVPWFLQWFLPHSSMQSCSSFRPGQHMLL